MNGCEKGCLCDKCVGYEVPIYDEDGKGGGFIPVSLNTKKAKQAKAERILALELEVSILKVRLAQLEAQAHAPCAGPHWTTTTTYPGTVTWDGQPQYLPGSTWPPYNPWNYKL